MLKIENSKFSKDELYTLYHLELNIEDIEKISFYNQAPYFNIKKLYKDDDLVGYTIIFLGYNSISSNDVSLEDIVYWGDTPDDIPEFLEMVKNANDLPFEIDNFYYNSSNIPMDLDILGFIKMARSR